MSQLEGQIVSVEDFKNLPQWLESKAKAHKFKYLLAHAEDGVIWGKFDEERLITANQIFTELPQKLPALRLSTLQRCRVFGQTGELLLWRSNNVWKYRFIGQPDCAYIQENQMLWGTNSIEEKDGFTLIEDGSEGLRHAVPYADIPFSSNHKKHPLHLEVHHYINYDDDGLARINISRLVDLITI